MTQALVLSILRKSFSTSRFVAFVAHRWLRLEASPSFFFLVACSERDKPSPAVFLLEDVHLLDAASAEVLLGITSKQTALNLAACKWAPEIHLILMWCSSSTLSSLFLQLSNRAACLCCPAALRSR